MVKRRFVFLFSALLTALFAQNWLTPLGASRAYSQLPKGRVGLGFALFLVAGLVAAAVVWRDGDSAKDGQAGPVGAALALNGGLLYGAVALVVLATGLAFFDIHSPVAVYPWAVGLVLLVGAFVRHGERGVSAPKGMSTSEWLGLLMVIGLAFAWRFPGLADIPAQVHGDEAACGLEARRILRGEVANLLGLGWYEIPYLSFALSAAFMRIFGDDLFGLRMGSLTLGVATVGLLYLTLRRAYGLRVALTASSLLAVSHWHVHFSRIGTDYMQASFATMLTLFFFVRARQDGRRLDWVLAGLSIGLACSVYYAGRVILVILAAFLILERIADAVSGNVADDADRRRASAGPALLVLAAVLFVAPTFAVSARMPSTLTDRSRGVFLLSAQNLEHSFESTGTDGLPQLLALQAAKSLSAFNWRGERSEQHSHAAPLLDFWSGAAFAVGLIAFTAVGWRPRYRMIVLWFWANLILGSVLTVDAMFSPRMIVAVPIVFVFPALLLDRLCSLGERGFGRLGARGMGALLVGFVCASAVANYGDYFRLHVRSVADSSTTDDPLALRSRYEPGLPDLRLRSIFAALRHAALPRPRRRRCRYGGRDCRAAGARRCGSEGDGLRSRSRMGRAACSGRRDLGGLPQRREDGLDAGGRPDCLRSVSSTRRDAAPKPCTMIERCSP